MKAYSKPLRRELRETAGVVCERALDQELAKLEADFAQWRAKEIDGFELSDRIHKFHDGPSRELYLFYSSGDADWQVARGLREGLIEPSEVSVKIRAEVERIAALIEELETPLDK